MAIRGAVVLYNSSAAYTLANGNVIGSSYPSITWIGGRTLLTVTAPTFPTLAQGLQIQTLAADNSTWLMVGSGILQSGISTAQMYAFDAPPGQYKIVCNSGLVSGLYVTLTGVAYT